MTGTAVPEAAEPALVGGGREHGSRMQAYLRQLGRAGNPELEHNCITSEHCYSRPSGWRPENDYVRPAKKLFYHYPPPSPSPGSKSRPNSAASKHIDVVQPDEPDAGEQRPPFDMSAASHAMDECQRLANFIRADGAEEDAADDWEDKVDKILWSPVQSRVFNRTVRVLNSERIARLAKANSLHEPILRRASVELTARRFRETLASTGWDLRVTQWLHTVLFDHLPHHYLAIYLDILQLLRHKTPQLIDRIISVQPNINSKGCHAGQVPWETLGPLLKKSWDPVGPALNAHKPKKLPGNPILLVMPSGISSTVSARQHKWITQLGLLATVVPVNSQMGLTASRMSILTEMDQLAQAARAKIHSVRSDFPGRPIVLIGFNSGAALACQLSQSEHVTAIVCLGFPLNTVDGKRGGPDDFIVDLRCPVMFVIGQNAMLAKVDDIEEMRERMIVPTSLVIVGSADDHLRISTSKKISQHISQSIVDRCILDEVADFIGDILIQPHPLPLRSPSSINSYENRAKRNELRKRRNSASNSVDSEPISPTKKSRPNSPSQLYANKIVGIPTTALPRGTLVTLPSTNATRRKARAPLTYVNTKFTSDQLVASRITPQKQNAESSTGGITLNIGSFASLSPVGPIRFETSSINLHNSSIGKSNSGGIGSNADIKKSGPFIKVGKGNQVSLSTVQQNVAKIKMIMPKKPPQRSPKGCKSTNVNTPINVPAKVNPSTATATPVKVNSNPLPSIQATSPTNTSGSVPGKSATSSSILFTPKTLAVSSITSTNVPTTSIAPSQAADSLTLGGSCRKQSMFRSYQPAESPKPPNSPMAKGRSAKAKATPKIFVNNSGKSSWPPPPLPASSPSRLHPENSTQKVSSTSTNMMTAQYTPRSNLIEINTSLEDGLENILDIPIIIADDVDNLNNLGKLSPVPATESKSVAATKIHFINKKMTTTPADFQLQRSNQVIMKQDNLSQNKNQQVSSPNQVKYTRIILTKKNEEENSIASTKSNKNANEILVMNLKNGIECDQKTTGGTETNQYPPKSPASEAANQKFDLFDLNPIV